LAPAGVAVGCGVAYRRLKYFGALHMNKSELEKLTAYFRRTFGNNGITVKARPKLSDSAELYAGEEFLGIISRIEDEGETSYDLSMSILDIDLDD
jgi:hypothetical protein